MKPRSKALYQYLLQAGVLNGTPDEIDVEKREYRQLYKRKWKQQRRPRKEIRIEFTLRQFDAIKCQATLCRMRHTPYARKALLLSVENNVRPLQEEAVLGALQLVSMAAIATERRQKTTAEISGLLKEAERVLLKIIQDTL